MNNYEHEESLKKAIDRALQFYKYSLNISEDCPLFPEHVHIEPTNACNLRCVHCHQSKAGTHFTKQRGMMDFELFKKVIDEIKGVAARITLNQQGEPLLHPRIIDMVQYAKQAGLSVSILTNATRLSEEIAQKLIDLRLDRIVFSFEGSNQKVHESVRRGSDYYKTLKNILYFIKLNYEKGRTTFICMSMVESSYSRDDVEDYKQFFGALPINTIFINPLLTMSGSTLTSSEIDMDQFNSIPHEDIPVCRLPWESIVVNWDGTVSPCAVDYNEAHVIGDANTESLLDIFNGERMKKFRRCHIDRDYQWIEEQGALCASCNCRFNNEYDLRDLNEYVRNYIVRQTKVAAPKLVDIRDDVDLDSEVKYQKLIAELAKVEHL